MNRRTPFCPFLACLPISPCNGATVERSLVTLVLTIVELLRQLMERQAIRRFDQGELANEQIEQVGSTLMALDNRMSELCDYFEVAREDLNLDLGPLGPLLGRD